MLSGIWRWVICFEFMSTWKMPKGSEFAPIHTQPPPYAMPEVLRALVMTVFSSLPFQSTSHAASSGSGNTGRLYVFEFDAVIFC